MLFFLKYAPGPPGPLLQNVNQFLHTEPIASIVYALYWIIFFIIATPLVTAFLSIQLVVQLVLWLTGNTGADACNPKKWAEEKEMAVFVTGCDTGFGTEIAFRAAHEGFVVFAACLKEESKKQFDLEPRIHPLVMDVTKDDSVAAAVKEFTMWVNNEESPKKGEGLAPRVLHAVINNAGIGVGGEVDWLDMSMFHNVMEVNYMGMVRVCKGFLPILKEQAIKRTHTDSRILNIVSMAGIISGPGLAPYTASKHAAVAFTAGLRMELKCFGIQVSSVNPSFHGTVLVDSMGDVLHKVWDSLPESKREEYGQGTFTARCSVKLYVDFLQHLITHHILVCAH